MLHLAPLSPTLYPRGTFIAAVGFIAVSLYYDHAWRRLKERAYLQDSPVPVTPDPTAISPNSPVAADFVERDYLYWGLAISVFTFLLAGSADTPPTLLDHLVGVLMGLCGAIFSAMFAYGPLALWYLWKEWICQFRHILDLRRIVRSNRMAQDISSGSSFRRASGSFLRAIPVAVLWLIAGFALFLAVGVLLLKPLEKLHNLYQHLILGLLAFMFYSLWKSRSHAAFILRFFLLAVFTAIILAALFFGILWAASETAPLLVTFLAAMTALNALFYARWVRLKVLINNLQ